MLNDYPLWVRLAMLIVLTAGLVGGFVWLAKIMMADVRSCKTSSNTDDGMMLMVGGMGHTSTRIATVLPTMCKETDCPKDPAACTKPDCPNKS